MAQIFHPSTNTISRVSIFGAVFFVAGLLWLLAVLYRSPYVTMADVVRSQPVPFSHKHHAGELGIDCRYCHETVETSAFAGMPSSEVCMDCHSQIWSTSPMLEPVRESFRSDRSIEWQRVHDLPDFVFFDHSIHVAKGVACVTCHGRVDTMPLTRRIAPLLMEWCLECHRDPDRRRGPVERVFDMEPGSGRADGGPGTVVTGPAAAPAAESRPALGLSAHALSNCSLCHH